jgi:hypothetical protein
MKQQRGISGGSCLPRRTPTSSIRVRPLANNRRHRRLRYAADIIFGTQHGSFRGLLRDLSRSGAFIETDGAVPVGAKVLATIPFRKKIGWVSVAGRVVRNNDGGIGLKFLR